VITLPRFLAKKCTEDRPVVGEVEAHVSTFLTGGKSLKPELFADQPCIATEG